MRFPASLRPLSGLPFFLLLPQPVSFLEEKISEQKGDGLGRYSGEEPEIFAGRQEVFPEDRRHDHRIDDQQGGNDLISGYFHLKGLFARRYHPALTDGFRRRSRRDKGNQGD